MATVFVHAEVPEEKGPSNDAWTWGGAPREGIATSGKSSDYNKADVLSHFKAAKTELALLNYIHEHPSIDTLRGNPAAICAAMDDFAGALHEQTFLMTLGAAKRDFVTSLMASTASSAGSPPKVFLEFGSYVGYSALALGAALRDLSSRGGGGGQKVRYLTFDVTPTMAAITSSMAELAGLKDVVEVHVGRAGDAVRRLVREGKLRAGAVDFVLLDHWKDAYVADLQACEELGLLRRGSVVLADNIKFPGCPEFLAYVRAGRAERSAEGLRYETRTADFEMPNDGMLDQMTISTVV